MLLTDEVLDTQLFWIHFIVFDNHAVDQLAFPLLSLEYSITVNQSYYCILYNEIFMVDISVNTIKFWYRRKGNIQLFELDFNMRKISHEHNFFENFSSITEADYSSPIQNNFESVFYRCTSAWKWSKKTKTVKPLRKVEIQISTLLQINIQIVNLYKRIPSESLGVT